jgi:hypothetical protein
VVRCGTVSGALKKTQATAGEQAHIVTKLQYWSFLATED